MNTQNISKPYKLFGTETGRYSSSSFGTPAFSIDITATLHILKSQCSKEIRLTEGEQAMLRNAKFIRIEWQDDTLPNTSRIPISKTKYKKKK